MTKVNIRGPSESIEDDRMSDLLDALVKAFGDNLPETISSVSEYDTDGRYERLGNYWNSH